MCQICVTAQDGIEQTGGGPTADAWARASAMFDAWIASLPDDHDVHDLDIKERLLAWAAHIDDTCTDRPIN